jgi:hypothetical protein
VNLALASASALHVDPADVQVSRPDATPAPPDPAPPGSAVATDGPQPRR